MAVCQLNQLLKTAAVSVAVFALWGCERRQDGFFDTYQGGDPIWFQHFFWLIAHPQVHLPILALVLLSTGLIIRARLPKLWRGLKSIPRRLFSIPGLWLSTLGFVFLLEVGRQIFWSTNYAHTVLHDTYYVVAHWHYVISLSMVLIIAALLFWLLPKVLKCAYNVWLARLCWLFGSLGVIVLLATYLAFPVSNLDTYDLGHNAIIEINRAMDVGVILIFISAFFFPVIVIEALVKKRPLPHKLARNTEDYFE